MCDDLFDHDYTVCFPLCLPALGGCILLLIGGGYYAIGIRHERYYSDTICLVLKSSVHLSRCGSSHNPETCYTPTWDVEYNRSTTLYYSTIESFDNYHSTQAAIYVLNLYPVRYLLRRLTLTIFNFICRLTPHIHASTIIVQMKTL